ncbi:unnamed protein product, partial [marine sediment metagenome]
EIIKQRQDNKFDACIVVSGARGNGKSTFLFKLFVRFKKFKPWKHQVYSRKHVMELLERSKFGCILDDEAIRTSYKRNFFDEDQKLLIQMLNMYRDNFNVYAAAVPDFYSLDKDLRSLIKIHIHIIERGLGVVHIANEGTLYSDDCWDVKYNKRIEENWAKRKQMNPDYQPKYHRLTTFRGYIKFNDLTLKQREFYEDVKVKKRKAVYDEEINKIEDRGGFYDRIIERLQKGEIKTKKVLQEICLINGLQYSSVRHIINTKLTDRGIKETLQDF